ncbi:MAG: CHAP domain-containing protein [Clostridium sp.]|nr:CHAP domain-containing protein [Clostridium sp.]MCM1460712.1 CHAP domain-containing protein [Bacteroides sp.]
MANLNQKFADNARKYVKQGPTTFRKWFYGSEQKGIPWCAIFVSYVANVTGILGTLVKKSASSGETARSSVKAGWGKWYEGHNTKPQVGDIILFTHNGKGRYPNQDIYFSDHIGIVYKVDTNYVYTVEGNTNSNDNDRSIVSEHKYKLYSGLINGYFRPNWPTVEPPVSNPIPNPVPNPVPDAIYRVRAGNKWYPAVKNSNDYAGIIGIPITDVAIKFSKGIYKYRVHVKGGNWLPWVTGYNISDDNNGYAGNKKEIDAIQIVYDGKLKAHYRVSPVNRNYYPFQDDNETTKGQDGYAGSFGTSIDRLQIILKS